MKQKAFTLIELLTVITIIGILFAITLPNYLHYKASFALRNDADMLFNTLQEAFTFARSYSTTVEVEASSEQKEVQFYICEDTLCEQKQPLKTFPSVKLSSYSELPQDFRFQFTAPFGDIRFLGEDASKDTLSFPLQNKKEAFTFTIYKHSGLISISPSHAP